VQTFTLDYAAGPGGDVSGNLSQVVDINTNGTPVEAEPDSGFRFVQWSDESTQNPRTDLNVTANVNVTAEFVQTFTVVYSVDVAEGSITGNTNQVVDLNGDASTVTAEAATGFTFSQWSDGVLTAERTDTNVTGNINVTAEFEASTFTLAYTTDGNGTINGEANQIVNFGGDGATVTAEPAAGYSFTQWSDGVLTAERTDTNITANLSAEAQFGINAFTVTYTADVGGNIVGNASQTVEFGEDAESVTAEAETGYSFVQWSDGNTNATRTDTYITGNVSFNAVFAIDQFTLVYNADPIEGFIDGDDNQTVDFNTDGDTVEAIPNAGFRFVQWSDGSTDNPRTDLSVTANVNVTAEFVQTFTLDYAAGPGGDVSGNLSQVVDINTNGSAVEAEPDSGFRFVQWSDESTENPRTDLDVEENISVIAEFAQQVTTWQQLHEMRNNLSGNYILMNDLGPSDAGYTIYAGPAANSDLGWEPVGAFGDLFTGSLDGNGFTISGLTIDRTTDAYVGLFGVTSGGTIENLALSDVDIIGEDSVGAFSGLMIGGEMINSSSSGTVAGSLLRVGGLVGEMSNSTIMDSYSTAEINGLGSAPLVGGLVGQMSGHSLIERSFAAGDISGESGVGGLVGMVTGSNCSIVDSYATGNVALLGISGGGGLVGSNDEGLITGSYATGSVTGSDVGGLVGIDTGTITNSYYNNDTAGDGAGSPYGTALNTGQMTGANAATNMTGFDFTDVWTTVVDGVDVGGETPNSNGYPILKGLPALPQLIAVGGLITQYTLAYNAGTGGSISGPNPQTVAEGGNGTPVEAEPASGFRFVQWSDGNTNATRTDTNVIADINVTAQFVQVFTLTYSAGTGGTITGTANQVVDINTDGAAVTAEPSTGFRFVQWSDGNTNATRTDINVIANINVTSQFVQIFTVTYDVDPIAGGSITGTANQVVDINTDGAAVTAEPSTGYRFDQWSDGNTNAMRTDTNVIADINVTAQFVQVFTLTYSAGTGGTITGTANQVVDINTDGAAVTAEPSTGFRFVQWS
ncbi:MAG: InlB B-repeat-containing protein, partial [Candidatus Sumerlaeia bacterium]|nr:InlB B-repeat-containing protein [Candidatus Sumerlaeia bacterium]